MSQYLDDLAEGYGYHRGSCPVCGATVWSDTGEFECEKCGETRAESESQKTIVDDGPIDPLSALGELRMWLQHYIQYGPVRTLGDQAKSGHPYYYTVIQIPDWDVKQKLDLVEAAIKYIKTTAANDNQ